MKQRGGGSWDAQKYWVTLFQFNNTSISDKNTLRNYHRYKREEDGVEVLKCPKTTSKIMKCEHNRQSEGETRARKFPLHSSLSSALQRKIIFVLNCCKIIDC